MVVDTGPGAPSASASTRPCSSSPSPSRTACAPTHRTGLVVLPMALLFFAASLLASRVISRFGRAALSAGAAVQRVGLASLAAVVIGRWPHVGLWCLYLSLAPDDITHAFTGVGYVQMGIVALPAVGAAARRASPRTRRPNSDRRCPACRPASADTEAASSTTAAREATAVKGPWPWRTRQHGASRPDRRCTRLHALLEGCAVSAGLCRWRCPRVLSGSRGPL